MYLSEKLSQAAIAKRFNVHYVTVHRWLRTQGISARKASHRQSDTLTYRRWRSMLARCFLHNSKSFPRYGGRGITVCDSWYASFENFLQDMGQCPGDDWTVERKDTNLDYTPTNCIWATRTTQNRNTSRNRMLTFDGKTLCASEWPSIVGIDYRTILARLNRGWSDEKTLCTPLKQARSRK